MKKIFFISTSGNLRRKDNTIFFEAASDLGNQWDENLNEDILASAYQNTQSSYAINKCVPINDIDSICVLADITFNKRFLEFLGNYHIPLHIFSWFGNYKGSFTPPADVVSGSFTIKQAKFYLNPKRRLNLAKKFVQGAAGNIFRNLRRYSSKDRQIGSIIDEILALYNTIAQQSRISDIMSIEARIHKLYYSSLNYIINSDIKFAKREFNPPTDPMNALISFANALVYSVVTTEIYRTKLDPRISFLHEPGERRLSLVYDISEIFKPIIADRLVFAMLNKNMLSGDNHFNYKSEACYLNEVGRRKVLENFDRRINRTIKHREINKFVSYKSLIRLECYKLIEHINKNSDYKPFQIWW